MNDFVAVQIIHRFADLFHKASASLLRQHKVFIDNSLEQLSALDSWGSEKICVIVNGKLKDFSYNSIKQ